MEQSFSFEKFNGIQRLPLAQTPTPLIELKKLSAFLKGPGIFMKREDLSAFGMGGNKVRKFEFFMAKALQEGADCCVAIGALQSNHNRVTAAAALHCDLKAYLLLMGEKPSQLKGNLLLNYLFGAEMIFIPQIFDFEGRMKAMVELADRLKKEGRKPYILPIVGAIGCLGPQMAMAEALGQADQMQVRFDRQFVAVGSGETVIGLALGSALSQPQLHTVGVCIGRKKELLAPTLEQLCKETLDLLGIGREKVKFNYSLTDDYLGESGHSTAQGLEAIRLVARTEGILLDPIYTGKTMAAIMDMIRKGRIGCDENVLFWNSASAPIFFAYGDEIKTNKD